jgi:hypothetical protein
MSTTILPFEIPSATPPAPMAHSVKMARHGTSHGADADEADIDHL